MEQKLYMKNEKKRRFGTCHSIYEIDEFDLQALDKEILTDFYADNIFIDQDTIDIMKRHNDAFEHPCNYSEEELKELFKKHDAIYMKLDNKLFSEAEELYGRNEELQRKNAV